MESQNKLCRGNMIRACMATNASLTSSTEQKKELMSLTQIFYIYGGPIIWHMLCKIPAIWEQTGFNLRRQPLTIHSNLHDIVKESCSESHER